MMADSEPLTENVALFTSHKQAYTDETQDSDDPSQTKGLGEVEDSPKPKQDGVLDCQLNSKPVEGMTGGGGKPPHDDHNAIPSFDKALSDIHEKAMQVVGFGRMQWLLYLALGLAYTGDGVELLLMAYILPGAEKEFCMSSRDKGWLGAIAFAGMMFGAPILGNLSDKVGRKPVLISSLFFNTFFNVAGALMPDYWLFFICRFFCGACIGGSVPIVMTCATEFSSTTNRGLRSGMMMAFFVVGGVYGSLMGWIIIPSDDELAFSITEDVTFHSWRLFLLVCSIPIIVAACCLVFMPESPRFLLQVGHDLEALAVYRRIYVWNHTTAGAEYEMPEIELPSRLCMTELQEKKAHTPKTVASKAYSFCDSFYQIFYTPLTVITCVLMFVWFAITFGYYGVSIWFPEYMNRLEEAAFFSQTNHTNNVLISNGIFTNLLSNIHFSNTTFLNVNFTDIDLLHVTFKHCVFSGCHFFNVTGKQSHFIQSAIFSSVFNDTNFYPSRFIDTVLENTTVISTKPGCKIDFQINYNERHVFFEAFVSQLAAVPTTVLAAVMLDKLGRVKVLVVCMVCSGASMFLFWAMNTEVVVVVINIIFSCLVTATFNALLVVTIELYPTHLRSTSFSMHVAVGRTAAILGNVTFGNLIDVSKALPILITASLLMAGGLLGMKLPESKKKLM